MGGFRDFRVDGDFGAVPFGPETAGGYVRPLCFNEIGVAVYAGAFVEPAFFKGGIGPYGKDVGAAVEVYVGGDVVGLSGVSAGLRAHVNAVEPDACVAENSFKPYGEMAAFLPFAEGQGFTVPANAGLRVFPAYGLVAVGVAGVHGTGE